MTTQPSIEQLKQALQKAGIMNERIVASLDRTKTFVNAQYTTNSFLKIKRKLLRYKQACEDKKIKPDIDLTWALHNIDKVNKIDLDNKLLQLSNKTDKRTKREKKEHKKVHELINLALRIGVEPENNINFQILKLNTLDIKTLRKKIDEKLLPYDDKQKQCIIKLAKTSSVPTHIIKSLMQAINQLHFDKILDALPTPLLIKSGLIKTRHGENHLTKNSIKAISTPMRD